MKTKWIVVLALLTTAVSVVAQSPTQPAGFVKTVASTGTPEAVSSTNLFVRTVTFTGIKAARTANAGTVYVGFTSTNDEQFMSIASNGQLVMTAPEDRVINLKNIYIDVANNGDGVGVAYMQK